MKEKKPVVIGHLRLDHAQAKTTEARRQQMAARLENESCFALSLAEAYEATAALNDSDQQKRIKEINAFLESKKYVSREPDSKGKSADATKLTIAKLRGSPMAVLLGKDVAKGEELMAAREIELAFMALSGALMFRPLELERTSKGQFPDWPAHTCQAVRQYQSWANYWSIRRKAHLDHTLECVIAAVIDQRPIRVIAEDLGFQHKKIERAVLGGLRDYAARAGWVDGKIAQQWMTEAAETFQRRAVA